MQNKVRSESLNLTWQMIVMALAAFCIIIGVLMLVDNKSHRPAAYCLITLGSVFFVIALAFQLRRSLRKDLQPDVLALLVPEWQLIQVGDAHLWTNAARVGDVVRVGLIAQNTTDGHRTLDVALPVRSSPWLLVSPPSSARLQLGPATVCALRLDIPIAQGDAGTVRIGFNAHTTGEGGKTVRFRLRGALQRASIMLENAAMDNRGEGFLEIDIQRPPQSHAMAKSTVETSIIWEPGIPVDRQALLTTLESFLEGVLQTQAPPLTSH